ncbi:MAG: SUMF1/EgtB/PvdO family nonheme iron enzyme [Acidobacteria bacterium]|nr:SUMF1/EgtB/PvdO family nonheme iron enzyme [Acidobacteriota bacterium]
MLSQSRRVAGLNRASFAALVILSVSVFMLCNFIFPNLLRAQAGKELSVEDIVTLIKAEVASRRIEALVEERGISFELTPEAERELRGAGANSDLIEVVRAHSKPPAPAELVIESKPGGADVHIDGRFQAKTSSGGWAKISPLKPGKHDIRISVAGFDDFIQLIDVKSGETFSVNAPLTRAKQASLNLFVASNPPGANVYVDGKLIGATGPAGAKVYVDGKLVGGPGGVGRLRIPDLQPGKHVVRVSAEGYADFEQSVELVTGKPATVIAVLERPKPATAGLVLESVLRGATVTVDGRLVDKSSAGGSLNIPDLAPGKHTVRVAAEGYTAFEQIVDLGAGSVLTLRTPLLPLAPSPGLARMNAIDGLQYVWIPPGTFMMGCSPGEAPQCLPDEKPSHRVTISRAFWLGQSEVTVAAYKRFVAANGIRMPDEPTFGDSRLNPGWANELMPMVNVSREDAEKYCTWAGGRLPTEAEWEYAARAGTTEGRYGMVGEIAWYANNSGRAVLDSELIWKQEQNKFSDRLSANGNTFHPVMQKKPNAYSLYDILGNVWEWVSDWYEEKYYSSSPELDPRGPASGEFGVQRGGSWFTGPRVSRAAPRYKTLPLTRGYALGIRCARDAAP